MKALALLMIGFSVTVHAQPQVAVPQGFNYNYQVICGPVVPIIEFLSKTQREEFTWSGSDISDGSVYSLWQDVDGNFHSFQNCKLIVEKTMNFYLSNYSICTSNEGIKSDNIRRFIPKRLRMLIKILLSRIFPLNIG